MSTSCQHENKMRIEQPPQKEELENKIIPPKEINDTILVELSLVNRIHKVYAKKSGKIIHSELSDFSARKVDTSTLIMSIDNRDDFVQLRDLKKILLLDLENSNPDIRNQYDRDFEIFNEAFRLDNLLPEINSERFSVGFISWFKKQSLYTNLYMQAKKLEDDMIDYFYVNQSPIFLSKVNVRMGDYVKKGSVLYEYMTDDMLIYQGGFDFSADEIQALLDATTNTAVNNYTIKDKRLIIKNKVKKNYTNTLLVKVVLKKRIV